MTLFIAVYGCLAVIAFFLLCMIAAADRHGARPKLASVAPGGIKFAIVLIAVCWPLWLASLIVGAVRELWKEATD